MRRMEDSQSMSVWVTLGWRVLAAFLGFGAVWYWRWFRRKSFIEFDRSMLVRLGTDTDYEAYANAPVIVGPAPFSDRAGVLEPDLDTRNVVGFVVGPPIWLDNVRQLRVGLDRNQHKAGYYAYLVIHWEHADAVKRFAERGFHVRRVRYNGPQFYAQEDMRETTFIGFGTNAKPDETGDVPVIVHISGGWRGSFRYQPYLRGGFQPYDIKLRTLPWHTKLLIIIKDRFTEEWRNA